MKVLVVGGGGREHALVWKIAQSPKVEQIYCAPGNDGMAPKAQRVPIGAESVKELLDWAAGEKIDLTVVGPEAPLVAGIADRFAKRGLKVFGPNAQASRTEGSKVFTKNLLRRHRIPTGDYQVFDDPEEASRFIRAKGAPLVVKADGQAKGKGVIVATDVDTALEAIDDIMVKKVFGASGDRVVVEDCLVGHEMSIQVFTDGQSIVPMAPARDYKRAYDRDEGLNTGGMGCYSPVPLVSGDLMNTAIRTIIRPVVDALRSEGTRYRGVLYAGLMLTNDGLKMLEINSRFGDPEAQVVVPRMKTDLVDVLMATTEDRLGELEVEWTQDAAVCVVIASRGYPASSESGVPIRGLDAASEMDGVCVFHAGTALEGDQLVTAGGRVLGVTGLGRDLAAARARAYEGVGAIEFDGMHYRTDIAAGVS